MAVESGVAQTTLQPDVGRTIAAAAVCSRATVVACCCCPWGVGYCCSPFERHPCNLGSVDKRMGSAFQVSLAAVLNVCQMPEEGCSEARSWALAWLLSPLPWSTMRLVD